jgi:RNA polymerase sigma-70 factor (ECF subfamily)
MSLAENDDIRLMLRVKARDRDALAALYARYAKPLLRFIVSMVGRREVAEDALQETFLRVWRAAPTYEPAAAVSTWLFTIARNAALNLLARERGRPLTDAEIEEVATVGTTPGSDPADGTNETLRAAIDRLPPGERAVVILSAYAGLRYADIGRALGIPVGTVKSRMSSAVARLRRMIQVS